MATISRDAGAAAESAAAPLAERIRPYAFYALGLLTVVNMFSYVDRQILSILAQSIKQDLHLDDAQLGFLLGTAFAIFYAVVGIAMGRIADSLSRKWTMAIALSIWSCMTALGGAATGFVTLAVTRIGVGAGEAAANPCSYSLLSEYFPARNRAAVLGTYVAGTFVGSALALVLGGLILQNWPSACSIVPIAGACGLAGWRAALVIVGIPGIPLALLVAGLREPPSGHVRSRSVGRILLREFSATIPPFTIATLHRAAGWRAVIGSLSLAGLLAGAAALLVATTGDVAQWCAVALGAYVIITWAQIQKTRDRVLYALTFGCPTFMLALLCSGLIACINGAAQAWATVYALRTFALSPAQIGLAIGLVMAVAAAIGLIAGGWIADRLRAWDRRAPLWIGLVSLLGGFPCEYLMLRASDATHYIAWFFAYSFFVAIWPGAYSALVQDLVISRMRGTAAAISALVTIVIASGMGPYWAGKVSELTGSLKTGMLSVQLLLPIAAVLMIVTARRLTAETPAARQTRAIAAGEPLPLPL